MGPKKDPKKAPQKRDQGSTIEEPINTDSWRCVVVMAVEKTLNDSFVLKEFMEEFSHGRRQEVGLIDFETFVLKILKEFATGELQHKYPSLINFSSILQEANEYLSNESDIPAPLLVKVVKVLLFYLREESLLRIEKKTAGPPDPILAMAERPANFGVPEPKKKEPAKKVDNAPKVRPPSFNKQDTKLLKRGEPVKDGERIDDAPLNGYFNLYVLLTGFYHPDFPLELLKGGIPLHGLICIDTSLSGVNLDALANRSYKHSIDIKSQEIQNFWDVFIKILWDPKASPYFKDTVFQVYVPRRLCCEKNKLREFIYREISYLMYDLSDFKRQLNNYLEHLKLWDVEDRECEMSAVHSGPKNIPEECASVPLVLQYIIDSVCGEYGQYGAILSSDSIDSMESKSSDKTFSWSAKVLTGSYGMQQNWSEIFILKPDFDLLRIYHKTKELDIKYDLDNKGIYFNRSERKCSEERNSEMTCDFVFQSCGENMKEALAADGGLQSYWKKYDQHEGISFALDYCLYPILVTRVFCPYLANNQTPRIRSSCLPLKKNSSFQLIENLTNQMRKPHFTVTESSRSILKALPYNFKDTSKDFFRPAEFKVVSPEMVKASSAFQFRVGHCLKVNRAFASEIFSQLTSKDTFTNLRQLLGESFFANINGFDYLEVLGKEQLLDRRRSQWQNYSCVDHVYCLINDCIFIALHNRMDSQNIHHETFNEVLRTGVGLRDFYEYILEDEADWLANQEQSLHMPTICKKYSSETHALNDFSESDFWLPNSIKYQEGNKFGRRETKDSEVSKIKSLSTEKAAKGDGMVSGVGDTAEKASFEFEGYNVSDMAVQFSGLKTVYYSNDCSMGVELYERLYGNQELGIHVTAGGHGLHLYSYVCPEPHIIDPFTFHLTYANGIIVAFTRRFTETMEEVDEIIESRTASKGKKNSAELSTRMFKRQIHKTVKDEEFIYDMAASLPNGLCIRTVRRQLYPCYIVQQHLGRTGDIARLERSRLFLPNGNVIKMLKDGTVEVLKPDTSTMTACLKDLVSGDEPPYFHSFHFVSSEGCDRTFADGKMATPSQQLQILQNIDVDTNQVFFRRRDGTSYVLQDDGSLCMEFKDGTKISSSIFAKDDLVPPLEDEIPEEADSDLDFLLVYTKTIMEHPDYVTVIFDTYTNKWTLLLPHDSIITIDPDGQYSVDIDRRTELRAEEEHIQMNRYSSGREMECAATADLSVFESKEGGVYCHMEDLEGKIFIVEANSNCYILDEEQMSEDDDTQVVPSPESQSQLSLSEFIASEDLQCSASECTEKGSKLSRSNKYFVLKRDMTGFELLHFNDVNCALSEKDKGSLIFADSIPGTDNRLFVLLTPGISNIRSKWQVTSVLPNPRYKPNARKKETSSTYGCPPSWMHPFPKRKRKFRIPYPLSCRVFIETTRTEFSPSVGQIDCSFCELADAEVPRPRIPPEAVEDYLTRLSDNDQQLLGEMYAHVANSLINEKRKLKSDPSEKLQHYLELSVHYVTLQEYHKECIRYHNVPNYFHHPAGMSWLILNDIVEKLKIADEPQVQVPCSPGSEGSTERSSATSKLTTSFSNEEIEYNISPSGAASFSELSYRSDLSAQTAPAVLRTAGLCRCKVSSAKDVVSAPIVKCFWEDTHSLDDLHPPSHTCDFQEKDLDMLHKGDRHVPPMTLEDLMCLGLV